MRLPKGRVPRQQRYTASVPSAARYETCAIPRSWFLGTTVVPSSSPVLSSTPAARCPLRDDRVTEIDTVADPSGRFDVRITPQVTPRHLGDRRFERVPPKRHRVVTRKRGGSRDGRGRRRKGTGAMGGPLPPPAGGRRRSRSQRTRYCRGSTGVKKVEAVWWTDIPPGYWSGRPLTDLLEFRLL
ncbi:uncharacterized protein LOC143191909 isoform X1 [Rhynchophorus ferrugineus]|uniref:uncharacterized protein LOC143191909 isoform X1 n=1 Tax=Rhynchophorus ferrugineus TaxID=354439 RepID=UPI003FCCD588